MRIRGVWYTLEARLEAVKIQLPSRQEVGQLELVGRKV